MNDSTSLIFETGAQFNTSHPSSFLVYPASPDPISSTTQKDAHRQHVETPFLSTRSPAILFTNPMPTQTLHICILSSQQGLLLSRVGIIDCSSPGFLAALGDQSLSITPARVFVRTLHCTTMASSYIHVPHLSQDFFI